ncbi:hypothetical protein, partial [Salmonella enterica]|uniref:hypothetical protein n=1 Tax=Salmonella enterica TaxID=28901 RepID=UPI000CAA92AF
LGKALDTEPVQRFVEMLNNNAGPMLESFGKMAGNMFLGLINLLVAFEPIGQTVVDKMLELSESFAQWSSTLDENQAFQSFLDYVSANTPAVLSLISGLIDLIINVVTSLAPLGSAVLNVADSFVQWINELIESNEWIVQVAGTSAVLASAFMA